MAHAIGLIEEFVVYDDFIVFLGDNYPNDGISGLYCIYSSEDMDGMFALVKIKNHSQFGIAEVRKRKIVNLVEKPTEPKSDLVIAGVFFLKPEIEINFMDKECTGRRFEDFRSLEHEVCAWTGR
jgi:glucose-1-phosphate thymidylyltransferase